MRIAPGLAKLTRVREGEKKPGRRRVSILVGNGGLYLPQELRRGADGAMTGFAWPEMLVQVCESSPPRARWRRRRTCSTSTCRWCATSSSRHRAGAAQGSAVPPRRHQEPQAARAGLVADGDRSRRARQPDRAAGAAAGGRRSRRQGRGGVGTMADYDLIVRNAKIVTAERQSEGDIAVKDGKVAALGADVKGTATREIDAGGQVRAAGRRRQPLPYRAALGHGRDVRRRFLYRHGLGRVRRHHDGDPVRRPASRHVAAPGGEGLSRGGDAQGGDRLRLPPDHHRSHPAGAGPGAAGADQGRLHLVQDLHDLRCA